MKAKELRDILVQQAARWGEYHDHKETMAWSATALQLTLYSFIIFQVSEKTNLSPFTCIILSIIVILTCRITSLFVKNQLNAKSIGADITAACTRLSFCCEKELDAIIKNEEEMSPLLTLDGEKEKDTLFMKTRHPSIPKFIFIESEKQRALDTNYFVSLKSAPSEVIFPRHLAGKINYDTRTQLLIFMGIMSEQELNDLQSQTVVYTPPLITSGFDPLYICPNDEYNKALKILYNKSRSPNDSVDIIIAHFKSILFTSSQALTIRQKTESYYYLIIYTFAIICLASIWIYYFTQKHLPHETTYLLKLLIP
jgi:hypothetical protein